MAQGSTGGSPGGLQSRLLEFAVIFGLIFLVSQFALPKLFPKQFGKGPVETGVILQMVDATVKGGHHPEFTIANNTSTDLTLPDRCPMPPVEIFFFGNPESPSRVPTKLETTKTAVPCTSLTQIKAGETETFSLAPWKYSMLNHYGLYEIELPVENPSAVAGSGSSTGSDESQYREGIIARFTISEPGALTKLFRAFITKPFLNFLILTASYLPGHNLGVAIIILTILVKLLLFWPTQKAMEGQREMQKLQPKIEDLKQKYKNNPEELQRETMKLWKEHNINPLQSCLPTLIQFPVLIGLFYVIRDGSTLALSRHLIYEPYQHLSWTFGTHFLWLDLLKADSLYIIPVLLVLLQFAQMKLAFTLNERKKKREKIVDVTPGKEEEKKPMSSQDVQQKVMMYGLPLMIGFFALQFPAAVSLYWGISTIFGIGQQVVVNKISDKKN